MIIGIDLGTTNSVVAYLSDDGPRLIHNALGESLTPSVIGVDEGDRVLIGRAAKELMVLRPERCAAIFKRRMGSDWSIKLGARKFTPELLSSLVLRQLKQDAESHLGQPVTDAVITVPAYFNEPQRKATINAGRIAGLNVRRILNEPTAAALAYGFHGKQDEKSLAIIDLGGGTFDVSIVDLFEGALEVRSSAGECFLGGEDFTRALAAKALEQCGYIFERAEVEHPLLVSRTIQQCELAKRELSASEQTTVRVPDRHGLFQEPGKTATFTREQFEKITQPIVARLELPIRRALGDAGLNRTDVDEVILVGGATRMPEVIERITQIFGRKPQCRLNPDEVVALGAAVQAGLIGEASAVDDLVVTDVSPFTLGIEISRRLATEYRDGYFLPIIHRNTTIPVSRVERVSTIEPNQTRINLKVYQGESRRVEDNLLLGEFSVTDIPRGPAGQQGLDIRFTYDLNGVLEIEAKIVETAKVVNHVITRHARSMTDQELKSALAAMAELKVHPREDAANHLTLRRAERIYQELPPTQRQILSEMLDGFESAMALGDKPLIEQYRERLTEFLDQFEQGFSGGGDPNDEP
jgi:molecular chaperone HscC